MKFLLLIIVILISSCSRQTTPEGVLKDFVNYRFESNQDKEDITNVLHGIMKEKIEQMDQEELEVFLDVKSLSQRKFKVISKNCVNEEKCFLTYLIKYSQVAEDSDAKFNVEVKKIAELIVDSNSWKISDIRDIKTYIDSKSPIIP